MSDATSGAEQIRRAEGDEFERRCGEVEVLSELSVDKQFLLSVIRKERYGRQRASNVNALDAADTGAKPAVPPDLFG